MLIREYKYDIRTIHGAHYNAGSRTRQSAVRGTRLSRTGFEPVIHALKGRCSTSLASGSCDGEI